MLTGSYWSMETRWVGSAVTPLSFALPIGSRRRQTAFNVANAGAKLPIEIFLNSMN